MTRLHQHELNQFDLERKELCEQIHLAEGRSNELQTLKTHQNQALEEFRLVAEAEKRLMEQKLDQLESKLQEQQLLVSQRQFANAATGTRSRNNSTGSEGASYEQQIDFLNSVIVDMQKKNDELRNRVQVLEEIGKSNILNWI